MTRHRSRRHAFLLAAVAAVLALQFMYVLELASGAPQRVAARKVQAQDERAVVAAGNRLQAPRKSSKPGGLPFTGGVVAPTVSIALMLMLDGALMVWLSKSQARTR